MTYDGSEYRCACGKLLLRGMILSGSIEIKCRSCKSIRTVDSLQGSSTDTERYVLVVDASGALLKCSNSALNILGYQQLDLMQKNVSEIIVMLAPEFYATLWTALLAKHQSTFHFQSLQRHSDLSMTPVDLAVEYHTGPTDVAIFTVSRKLYPRLTTSFSNVM